MHASEHRYSVYLVNDGVSSMRVHDRECALRVHAPHESEALYWGMFFELLGVYCCFFVCPNQRLENAGAVPTTAESCLYELMGDAKHEKFKACLPLVQTRHTQLFSS